MAFSNLDALLEEDEKKRKASASSGGSASQSGGAAYSASKPSGGSNLDQLVNTPMPKPQQVSQTQQAAPTQTEEKKGFFSTAVSKVAEYGGKALKAGLDLWNAQSQKNEVASFEMRQLMYGKKTLEVDPVSGKKTLQSDTLKAYRAAATPEEKQAIIDADTQQIPLIKAMNSDTGRKVLSFIGEKTSNVPLKAIASLKSLGDQTYDEAYAALEQDRMNPENGAFKSFLYELQDSGVQSGIGVLLSLGATYASRNPKTGQIVGSTYFTGISAAGQQEERGKVDSLGNIAIDVVGDQVLSTSLESVFKGGVGVIRTALKSAGIEGTTEVGQSFLKYGNDYANARTEEEKDAVIEAAKKYVVEGGMIMEFAVGGVAGGIIGGTAEAVAPSMTFDVKGEGSTPPEGAGTDERKAPAAIATPESEGYFSNARDVLAEYETALANGENVGSEEEFANVAELRTQLDQYQTLNKDKTFFLPERAEVEVVQYDDGNFAFRFSANAGGISVNSPFINTELFKSEQEATEAGLKEILAWVREQRTKAETPEQRAILSKLQDDMIDASQRGEQDYSGVIAPIAEERKTKSANASTLSEVEKAAEKFTIDRARLEKNGASKEAIEALDIAAARNRQRGRAIDPEAFRGYEALDRELLGDEFNAEPETQAEKVKKAVKGKAKTIKEVAEETGILEPNVRRILGVGTKDGVFERVDKGVYTLSIGDKDIAFIETGSAVESLPRLAAEGFKADMIFLDIPYNTAAVKGGNRGVKYDLLSVADFKKVVSAVSQIVRTDDTPVLHMFSQAASGWKEMEKYNDVLTDSGFKPIARGEWQKLFKNGQPVTNVRGEVAKPEGILLLSKSGDVSSLPEGVSLDFKLMRPKGYSTEKPAEMLKALIELTTEEDGMVLDPFAGSGVTAAEAVRSGRKAYAIEKNEEVAEKITKPRVKEAVEERKSKRIGLMDTDSTYTDNMNALIKEAQENGDTFPYLKMTTEEQRIVDAAFSKMLDEAPVNTPENFKPYVATLTTETIEKSRLSDPAYLVEAYESTFAVGGDKGLYKILTKELVPQGREPSSFLADAYRAAKNETTQEPAPAPAPKKPVAKGDLITIEPENLDDAEIEEITGGAEKVGNLKKRVITVDGQKFTVPDQIVTKTQLRYLIGKEDYLDFTVVSNEGRKYFAYESENSKGIIYPRALGIVEENIEAGETVRVTKDALKKKGTSLRAYQGGNAIGFIPKDELRDEVFAPIQQRIDNTKRVSGRRTAPKDTGGTPARSSALGFIPKNLADVDSKAGRAEVEKIIKRSDIAAELSKKLAVPIRRGKFRGKALGIYKPKEQLIRYKKGGLPTIFHESGHFIDYTIFPFGNEIYKNKGEIEALTSEYGAPLNTPKRQKEEAFAEFLRFYMTEPTKAKEKAPIFHAFFENQMRQLPEVSEIIEKAKADFERWNAMPATQKVLSQVSLTPDNESISERFSGTLSRLYSQTIDDLNPIFKYSELAEDKLGDLPAEENPYMLARNFRGWIGKANAFLETGTFGKKFWTENEKGKIVPNFSGKSFSAIIKPIEKDGALEDFTVYLISKRTVELTGREKPIETGISRADAQAAIDELAVKHPEFEQAAADLYKYQDDLLVFGRENGLYDDKALEVIREMNQAYVPFYRVMEEIETAGGVGKGFGNVRSNIKRIKGSDRDIVNPLESIVKNTYAVINAAERNNVATAIVSLSDKDSALGQMVEKVATPMEKAATVGEDEILKAVQEKLLKQAGIFGDASLSKETEEELAGILVNVFRPAMIAKNNTITVLKDGKRTFYEIDPDLYKAMQGLEVEHVGAVLKLLSYPARFLRAGATLTPEFVLRNPMRDQWSAFVYSKYNFIPFVDLARGMFSLFRKDSDYWLWRMGGGEHSMLASLDREYLTKSFDEVVKGKKFTDYVKNPLEVMQVLSEYMEKGTRLGEAKAALRNNANPIDAAFAAREVTLDFARIGEKTKAVNAIVAFFNAQVQGQDKMYRSFRDKPVRTLLKTMIGITLPSIILYFVNRDEEGWDEIPQWQKDLFWLVKVNDTWYRIPKPFELGVLFGSVPERMLEYMDKRDPQLFKDLQESVTNGLTPSFMPTFLLPIVENITNYNFFQERAIVPQAKTSLPPEAQYGNYTSETAKKLGELLKYSPAKIDNLLQGYFAGLGQYAVQVMDAALEGTGLATTVVAPAARLADQPILKAFMIKPPEGSGSNSVERFYTEWEKANEASKYIKQLQNDGEDEKAYEFLAEHPEAELAKYYNDVQAEISAMNKSRNEVYESDTISAQEKREILDEIDKQMTIVAHNAIEMTLNYGETE